MDEIEATAIKLLADYGVTTPAPSEELYNWLSAIVSDPAYAEPHPNSAQYTDNAGSENAEDVTNLALYMLGFAVIVNRNLDYPITDIKDSRSIGANIIKFVSLIREADYLTFA
jgi:hypothetical protein